MGEVQGTLFEPDFNRSVKVQTTDQRLTSNAGVILLREADHRLGLIDSIARNIQDPRDSRRIRYTVGELLRERIFAMAIGYSAQDDLDRLAHDPAFRTAVWDRSGDSVIAQRLASQPTQSRLIGILTKNTSNLEALRNGLADSIERHVLAAGGRRVRHATVDIDSFPIEVHGQQHGAEYNGYFRKTVYHPLVASLSVAGDYDGNREGERLGNGFIHAILRQGQVHTADGMKRFVDNVDTKAHAIGQHIDYRLDAGYTSGDVMDALCNKSRRFVGRLKTNSKLDALAAPHLMRPVGRPPKEGYQQIIELGMYQVETWQHAQRLVLVVVDQPDPVTGQLNLLPRYFFLITNWSESQRSAAALLEHYRRRGTFEDRLGEFNGAIGVHLSSSNFKENEATMLLALLSFNLSSLCRIELEDTVGGCWDLTRFQLFVLKVSAEFTKHSRRLMIRIAESAAPLWSRFVKRLAQWTLPSSHAVDLPRRSGFMPPPRHAHLTEFLRS